MENLNRLISTTAPLLNPQLLGRSSATTAPARQALGFPPHRVQCQQKCYSDISLLLSITCRLFTASIKYILCSGEIHCTGVSGNSLSFLLQNKTILTSVRFAVNNPSCRYRVAGKRKERGKEVWRGRKTRGGVLDFKLLAVPGLSTGGCTQWPASLRRKATIWQVSTGRLWPKHLVQIALLRVWNPSQRALHQRDEDRAPCARPPAEP